MVFSWVSFEFFQVYNCICPDFFISPCWNLPVSILMYLRFYSLQNVNSTPLTSSYLLFPAKFLKMVPSLHCHFLSPHSLLHHPTPNLATAIPSLPKWFSMTCLVTSTFLNPSVVLIQLMWPLPRTHGHTLVLCPLPRVPITLHFCSFLHASLAVPPQSVILSSIVEVSYCSILDPHLFVFYTRYVVSPTFMNYQLYAYDSQIYFSRLGLSSELQIHTSSCLLHISTGMSQNHCKVSMSKIKFMPFLPTPLPVSISEWHHHPTWSCPSLPLFRLHIQSSQMLGHTSFSITTGPLGCKLLSPCTGLLILIQLLFLTTPMQILYYSWAHNPLPSCPFPSS